MHTYPTEAEIFAPYSHTITITVQWGDMDAAGHVNNAMYLRYCETGRIEYLSAIGEDFGNDHISVIVGEIDIKYKSPVMYPDVLKIGTRVMPETIDEYSCITEQHVYSTAKQRVVAIVKTKMVCFDYKNQKKAPIPLRMKEKLV
jgi:acyl-CoA thioester hydrolase